MDSPQKRPFFLNTIVTSKSDGTLLGKKLCELCPSLTPARMQRFRQSLIEWLGTDAAVLEHIELLEKAGWTIAMIRQTLLASASPSCRIHANVLLAYQTLLQELNLNEDLIRKLILHSKAIYSAGGPEMLKRKLALITEGCSQEILPVFLQKYGNTVALALPEESIRQAIKTLRERNFTPSRIATGQLITYVRGREFKAAQQAVLSNAAE